MQNQQTNGERCHDGLSCPDVLINAFMTDSAALIALKGYLCYTVFWVSNGKSRNKTFQVGNAEKVPAGDEPHAFRTARLFRSCDELSMDSDIDFYDDQFNG